MNRFLTGALSLGFAAAALFAPTAASATSSTTAYTYDFTKANASNTYTAVVNGQTVSVKVTAWHANDTSTKVTTDSISAATLGQYTGAGLGVKFGNDNDSNGTHQIDNIGGGADFLMLQFSSDVSLSSISRNVYSVNGTSCCDSDASIWGDTGNLLGAPSSTANIDLTKYSVDESTWTSVTGTGSASTVSLSTGTASVWLISAAFNQSNDAFKLSGLTVNVANAVAPVPEPASWAMMIVGFGAVGATMRTRRQVAANA